MVLQRGKLNAVWGWTTPNEEVRVEIGGQTAKATSAADGKWQARIPAPSAGGPYTLKVDGPEHVEFHEVMVGDVWLCGGQSNMELPLGKARDGTNEIRLANHPEIRLYIVHPHASSSPAATPRGSWKICSPETVTAEGGFSAVGYFFGRRLQEDIHAPIGLIEDCVGGTPAEAWTSPETLRRLKNFDVELDEVEGLKAKGSEVEIRSTMPSVLYQGMIEPLAPLSLTGVIWYQGEANKDRAYQYRTLLPAMIADWRRLFGQGDFPFYIVSLPKFMHHQDQPSESAWSELREAQALTAQTAPNSGLAVTVDTGEADNIHPLDKRIVGERLAACALGQRYGEKIPYQGPTFKSMQTMPGALKLRFDHADGGLIVKGDRLGEFSVAGADRKWHWAEAKIEGDTIIVSSTNTPEPVAARYAWQSFPEATLYNGAGFPAVPFRTDDWPGVTQDAVKH